MYKLLLNCNITYTIRNKVRCKENYLKYLLSAYVNKNGDKNISISCRVQNVEIFKL